MEFKEFKLYETGILYKVEPGNVVQKFHMKVPFDFVIRIKPSVLKELYVSTGDGEFHAVDQPQQKIPMARKFITINSSLFASKDESVHCRVHQVLSAANVNHKVWHMISDAVMEEGIRILEDNSQISSTIMVDVVRREMFFCYEGVGES